MYIQNDYGLKRLRLLYRRLLHAKYGLAAQVQNIGWFNTRVVRNIMVVRPVISSVRKGLSGNTHTETIVGVEILTSV